MALHKKSRTRNLRTFSSAKRTVENSPAIYRWVTVALNISSPRSGRL